MKGHVDTHAGRRWLTTAAALGLTIAPVHAFAQQETPAAPPAESAPPAAPAPAPAAVPEAPAPSVAQASSEGPATPVLAAPPDTTAAPAELDIAAKAAPDESSKPLGVAVWGRIGNVLQSPTDSKKLTDVSQNAEVNLLLSGQIHQMVKWQADFVATYGPGAEGGRITGDAAILDLIGKLEFHDAINVWFGRMLVPSDRSNFSGAWFMSAWNYPGFYPTLSAPAGPRQGPFGRNDGATVWGQFGGGLFKYYAGAFDLHDPAGSPLYSGRLNLSLINPEPGYYHSSTYYGGKDVLAIGVSGQYKKNGSVQAIDPDAPPAMALSGNYTGLSVDALYEKKLGGAGTIDVEGAFYLFDGDYEPLDNHFYGLVSYLLPGKIGIGYLQPLVRYQGAQPTEGGSLWRMVDVQVGYAVTEYAARLALGYQNSKAGDVEGNAVFLGLQLQK